MPFPCRSPAALKANSRVPCRSYAVPMPFPCRDPATTLPLPCTTLPFSDSVVSLNYLSSITQTHGISKLFCSEQNIVRLVPYLAHEVLLLSPSSNYHLLNCYHNLCAIIIQSLMSLHQNNKLLVHDKRCLVSHWPPASDIGIILITTFLELRVVPGRS
jgi:hypothetical protein